MKAKHGALSGLPIRLAVEFVKGRDRDFISTRRRDGSEVQTTFPKKGWLPHDVIHLLVERKLDLHGAFWGRVFAGAAPDEVAAAAKAGGHASSSRAGPAAAEVVELVQAERLVECFEADLWAEQADVATFRAVYEAGCAQSRVAPHVLSDEDIVQLRAEVQLCLARWRQLAIGDSLTLEWPG